MPVPSRPAGPMEGQNPSRLARHKVCKLKGAPRPVAAKGSAVGWATVRGFGRARPIPRKARNEPPGVARNPRRRRDLTLPGGLRAAREDCEDGEVERSWRRRPAHGTLNEAMVPPWIGAPPEAGGPRMRTPWLPARMHRPRRRFAPSRSLPSASFGGRWGCRPAYVEHHVGDLPREVSGERTGNALVAFYIHLPDRA